VTRCRTARSVWVRSNSRIALAARIHNLAVVTDAMYAAVARSSLIPLLQHATEMHANRPPCIKPLLSVISAAALFVSSSTTSAQESPSEVTASQVAIYQLALETGCKNSGRRRGDSAEQVDAVCSCMMRVLKEDASFSEWQEAYYYSRKRLKREESSMLAAHLPKLQACK